MQAKPGHNVMGGTLAGDSKVPRSRKTGAKVTIDGLDLRRTRALQQDFRD
jgi:hypothetical protein